MYLSAPTSSLSTSLTSYLADLNSASLDSPSLGAPSNLFDVSSDIGSTPSTSTSTFDPAAGEVIWVGVLGPS